MSQMSAEEFVGRVRTLSPEFRFIVERHREQYAGEVLLHVLMAELRRWSVSTFYNLYDDAAVLALLELLDHGLRFGDGQVENAVAVSFIQDACTWNPRVADFVSAWPGGLRAEANRQQRCR